MSLEYLLMAATTLTSCTQIFFEKMGLKKENLWPYKRYDIHAFNETITHTWGYIELMVTLGEGRDTWIINS